MSEIIEKRFLSPPSSLWLDTQSCAYPFMDRDTHADIAVIGGGITGIMAAYMLKQSGLKVVLLEAGKLCGGATGHTTAKLSVQHSIIYTDLIQKHGERKALQYAQANLWAVDFVRSAVRQFGIDCDLRDAPSYVYAIDHNNNEILEQEAKSARRLGIEADFQRTFDLPIPVAGALRFGGQADFHPIKLLQALARTVPGGGSYIFEDTEAIELERGERCIIRTKNGHSLLADKVILATHSPFGFTGMYFGRMYAMRSYIAALEIKDELPEGMYISYEEPVHSIRPCISGGKRLLLVGGEGHKTAQGGDTEIKYKKLMDFARRYYTVLDMPYRWSAQDYMTPDSVPYIGRLAGRGEVYIAAGYKKWGMTTSVAAARIIRDLITGGTSPWQEVFDPSRVNMETVAGIATMNLQSVGSLISGIFKPASNEFELGRGEGRVVEVDGSKYGIYVDDAGDFHAVSASCTHMGCILEWNSAERTWDCPCHASRFDPDGKVLEGPAKKELRGMGKGTE
ncbi:MAG: FAD-dependent oxidoreductase [Eubacteriales bacterium]